MTGFTDPALPGWKAERVEAHRRAAIPKHCPKCHAPTLYGPDADHGWRLVHADPRHLDWLGEVTAAVSGRATFALIGAGRPELFLRLAPAVASPDGRTFPVLAEHRCTQPDNERTP